MTATINLPKIMQIGAGAINALPATLEQLGCHYPCIITDSTMVRLGYTESITDLLNAHSLGYGLFSETMAEPSEDSILPAVALVQREKYDCLLALGGGSAIDTAKAIALLATHGGS
ncbi:MAG: iron-containing alcohol dehydrogenase, partial [Paraglaciecola chathamensis]